MLPGRLQRVQLSTTEETRLPSHVSPRTSYHSAPPPLFLWLQAAVLTVFSYAVNDCVVVFDFIRSERQSQQPSTPAELKATVNEALSRVLIRSLLTLAMVMVCSLLMVFRGAEPLHAFSLAITFGLLSATYTTILIAAPFYYFLSANGMKFQAWQLAKRAARGEHLEWPNSKAAPVYELPDQDIALNGGVANL